MSSVIRFGRLRPTKCAAFVRIMKEATVPEIVFFFFKFTLRLKFWWQWYFNVNFKLIHFSFTIASFVKIDICVTKFETHSLFPNLHYKFAENDFSVKFEIKNPPTQKHSNDDRAATIGDRRIQNRRQRDGGQSDYYLEIS